MKIDKKWWNSTKNGENRQKMVKIDKKMVLLPSTSILDGATSGDGLGAELISRSQPKILQKIQKNLRRYISGISRFLHVWMIIISVKIYSLSSNIFLPGFSSSPKKYIFLLQKIISSTFRVDLRWSQLYVGLVLKNFPFHTEGV